MFAELSLQQILIGLFLAIGIAFAGYRAKALSQSGAWAAVLVGGLTFGLGGWLAAVLLITFFVTSSILSRLGRGVKREVATQFAKGGRRDHGQVFANGGLAAFLSILYGLSGQEIWLVGLAGALAAVNSDTWSTELGVLAKDWPRLITNGSRVEPGTSGGITLEGTLAALGGAATIGLILLVAIGELVVGIAVTLAGFLGSVVDSVFGATIQAIYHCEKCNKQTERHPIHSCGKRTKHVRGIKWFSNDLVNFVASLVGASLAILIHQVL
jgi:uncharacterized protein (TIGR00297 family)